MLVELPETETREMAEAVQTRTEGAVLEVTLDRPEANTIDLKTSWEMGETFRAYCDDLSRRYELDYQEAVRHRRRVVFV